jgi:hypothetical protein
VPNSTRLCCAQLLEEGEFALDLTAVLAAQPGDLGEQGLDLLVERLIFAIEEAGCLSQQFSILNLLETEHVRITSCRLAQTRDLLAGPRR